MVIYEDYGKSHIGIALTRAYSDQDMQIERDGILYDEAIDPTDEHREYNETDIPIGEDEEATPEDYEAALGEVGVDV